MQYFSNEPEKFLDELIGYLEKGPAEECEELREVSTRLENLLNEGHVETVERATGLLGTALGQNDAWRDGFRRTGLLKHALQMLESSSTTIPVAKQYLRVVGNCVADNDENRESVTESLSMLVARLRSFAQIQANDLIVTSLVVIFNLCNDFDPAQIEAAKIRLDDNIAELLVRSEIPEDAVDYAADLMTWTTEKLSPLQIEDDTSLRTFTNVSRLALNYDEDHYQDYVTILAHYLEDPEFQQKAATPEILEALFDLLLDFETRLAPEETQAVFKALAAHQDPAKISTQEINQLLMVQLVNSLSAISASDAFVKTFNLRSPVVKKVRAKLLSLSTTPSTVCACVVLGNLATTDQTSIDMVEDMGLHLTLIGILSGRREPSLLYAAAGFIRHLAFPEVNRGVLGEAGLVETCCKLLLNKDPSVRGEAAAILCKLVSNNFTNIEKIVYETVPSDITPTPMPGIEAPVNPTILYHLVTQALAPSAPLPSTSMKNAMIEIGRTIIAILRYLRQTDVEEDVEPVVRHMAKTPLVARPVARLVRQRFYAEARSEGLLGLGLLAQSHEGAVCVVEELKADEGLLGSIKELATDKQGTQQNGVAMGRDQQNALVLLHGLATNGVNALTASLKDDVDALLSDFSRLAVA